VGGAWAGLGGAGKAEKVNSDDNWTQLLDVHGNVNGESSGIYYLHAAYDFYILLLANVGRLEFLTLAPVVHLESRGHARVARN